MSWRDILFFRADYIQREVSDGLYLLVMPTDGEDIDMRLIENIDQSVFGGDTSGIKSRQ
jgi:hypothetical protein